MKRRSSKITDVLALLVFTVFVLCMLLVLLTGAGVYRNLVRSGEEQHTRRTAVRYITTRVRQAEAVAVEDFDGCSALVLREKTEGETYLTRVYSYDGVIRELYCAETARLTPEDGEAILQAESLTFELKENILMVNLGGEQQLALYLPAGREAVP